MNASEMLTYLLGLPASEFLTIRAAVRIIRRAGVDLHSAAEIVISAHRLEAQARISRRDDRRYSESR